MRQKIAEKMEELASINRYRLFQYTALRKEFPNIPIKEFLEILDTFPLSGIQHSTIEWIWNKILGDPKFKKLRNHHLKVYRESIESAKKYGVWDGVTIKDIIKFMGELEEERGLEYASHHIYFFYRRETK